MFKKTLLAAALMIATGLVSVAEAQTMGTQAPVTGPRPATAAPAATNGTTGTSTGTGSTPSSRRSAATSKLDINSASAGDLAALPGMTPAYSQAVIAGRPYRRKTDLVRKKIVPQAVYDQIGAKIIAHRVKS